MEFSHLRNRIQRFLLALICIFLCAHEPLYADQQQLDPLEKFNRVMFSLNDQVDKFILKPIATLYNKIVPKPLNAGIHNVFNNINTVPTIANDLLQLHIYQTLNDTWRLLINSTVGVGGLFDIASIMGLPAYSNDFGLTLARYGFKQSTYIVLPLLGPNTMRDTIEIPVDYYAFSIYPYIHPSSVQWGVYGLAVVDKRAQLLKVESVFDAAALDRYTFIRSAYLQRRNYQIQQNARLNFITRGTEDESITNSMFEVRPN